MRTFRHLTDTKILGLPMAEAIGAFLIWSIMVLVGLFLRYKGIKVSGKLFLAATGMLIAAIVTLKATSKKNDPAPILSRLTWLITPKDIKMNAYESVRKKRNG